MESAVSDRVPEGVIERLPLYLNALIQLRRDGVATVSSARMGELTLVNPAQIRRDLTHFGSFGKRGVGYDVVNLVDRIQRGQKVIVPGDGNSLWVLTWNADFAVGLLRLLGNPKAIGEAFHITSDEVLTWNQIFLELYSAIGMEPNIVHVPSDLIVAYDPEKLGTLIGDKTGQVLFKDAQYASPIGRTPEPSY